MVGMRTVIVYLFRTRKTWSEKREREMRNDTDMGIKKRPT
jgi:hypothetical protein